MTDHNCFIGKWPFYRLDGSFSAMCEEHTQNGITTGYVSSLESVFYNDFYESEKELAEAIADSGYYHTVTVNPAVQGFEQTLNRCFQEFDLKGIRLTPTYHNYSLADARLKPIIEVARDKNIPIFVNARLTDDRMTHMMHPVPKNADEYAEFVDFAEGVRIVLCYLLGSEADAVWNKTRNRDNLYFDTSGMAGSLFETDLPDYISHCVLGTGFPLRTVHSSVMRIEKEIADDKLRNIIFQ